MKRMRFTEEQIVGIWREQEAGAKVMDLVCKYPVSDATLCNRKAKWSGMEVSEARRLMALEDENASSGSSLPVRCSQWPRSGSFREKMVGPEI